MIPLQRLLFPCLTALALCLVACSESPDGAGIGNLPPETHLALQPDGDLRTTSSQQHIHWWGDDPDGFVAGYFISFDSLNWHFTTSNDSVFTLRLSGQDTSYVFYVRAVDGQGNKKYDANGPYGPEPYTDLNMNGVWDQGEPYIDLGLWDPTPASLRYPIQNSPPVVAFVKGTAVPETTFTVASFNWVGTDVDGDETIKEYVYAVNDTSQAGAWKILPRSQTFLTLFEKDGLREGNNVFYLKAVDIAGAESRIIRMPDSNGVWYVKKPRTELLVVDDNGNLDEAAGFYRGITDTLLGGRFYNCDVLDIKDGASSTKKGRFVPPFINPTLVETFKLFKYIIWYSDNAPSLDIAQIALNQFQSAGGHVLLTTSIPEKLSDLSGSIADVAPVDSLSPSSIVFIPAGTKVEPDAESTGYPSLQRDSKTTMVAFVRSLIRKINARNVYHLASGALWSGNPVVSVRSGDQHFVIFSIPLHRFDGLGTVGLLVSHIFTQEFGAR
jgi:hypothetical protein